MTSVVLTKDGTMAYAAAFNAGSVTTFKRDVKTGLLQLDGVVTGEGLKSVVSIKLSPDEKYAVACAFGTNTVTLFKRDPANGRLSILESVSEGVNDMTGLKWVIDARFSPKTDFLYVGSMNGVSVFELKDEKLGQVQFSEPKGPLNGVRGIAMNPTGDWIYVTAMTSDNLGVFKRDASTGLVSLARVLSNSTTGGNSLAGAFRSTVSADGKFLYVSSGRFRGDQAVSAFAIGEDGGVKLIQEFTNGANGFDQFEGGNTLALSPDGKMLIALASNSDRLFRFKRDDASGKLTFLGSQEVGQHETPGSAGLCFSPDGNFVYVADEASSSIVAFRIPK